MSQISKVRLSFLLIIILTIFATLVVCPNVPSWVPGSSFFNKFKPLLGLDLQGGAHLVYQADFSNIETADRASALEGARDVIERRVNAFGVAEPVIQTSGDDKIIVELAGVFDVQEAIQKIGETPLLEFKEQGQTLAPEEMDQLNSQAKSKAEDTLKKVLAGEDFAKLASELSEDPGSKDNGGIVDFYKQDLLDPTYADVIFNKLQNGKVYNQVVESQFGYHIIKKIEERGSDSDREVKSQHILFLKQNPAMDTSWINTQLSGKHLKTSNVTFDNTTGQAQVALEFNTEGAQLFTEITERNVGKRVAIVLDGEIITAPMVNEKISQGQAVISGNFTITEAKQLSQRLNAGALPVPIKLVSQQTVGATLGKESLNQSLMAGLYGLIVLAIFMILAYRFLGFISVIALAIYGVLIGMIFEMWPITLTLSGITGFIVSFGMAVDANVLILERTKEEIRAGKNLTFAVQEGFKRSWPSIRDSNVSSLITCLILLYLGSSMIKGFAITLGIGIVLSMFSAITITRTFLMLFVRDKMEKYIWFFGVSKKQIKQ
ncbi:MAG TPA: protein translocase subunit SecD [bacterium]|jgi:preprotein translocase subunit SecD|nr:protein translocase subunit SecD [bacterium]HOG38442.1 protein translocase subunit SecD [bacterium]